MMNPGRNPSLTCPRLLANSTRAVSMYWRYVALFTWPMTSMSRNWTGNSMINFTCDQRADGIRPNHREDRQPISTPNHGSRSSVSYFGQGLLCTEEICWSCLGG